MKQSLVLFLTVAFLLMITPRLPAPIVETPETPTPAPEQSESPKPRTKHSTKTTPSDVESSARSETRTEATPKPPREGPPRFTGTWSGKISQGLLGHTPTTLTVNATATSVELSHNLGGGTRPVTLSGNTISWHTGIVGEIAWTLTPNSDGQTAQVTMKGLLVNDTTTFRRRSALENGAKH